MHRRTFLKNCGLTALQPVWPRGIFPDSALSLQGPSHAAWPSEAAWKQLNDAVGGNLVSISSVRRMRAGHGKHRVQRPF